MLINSPSPFFRSGHGHSLVLPANILVYQLCLSDKLGLSDSGAEILMSYGNGGYRLVLNHKGMWVRVNCRLEKIDKADISCGDLLLCLNAGETVLDGSMNELGNYYLSCINPDSKETELAGYYSSLITPISPSTFFEFYKLLKL